MQKFVHQKDITFVVAFYKICYHFKEKKKKKGNLDENFQSQHYEGMSLNNRNFITECMEKHAR